MERMRVLLVLVLGIATAGCTGQGARVEEPEPGVGSGTGASSAAWGTGTEAAQEAAETIDLAFAGDVMFGRFVTKGFRPIPAERRDLFGKVASVLDSDFTMVNLETPILRKPPRMSPYGSRMRFVATPARVASLKAAHIDGVTLANNHAYDMHHAGLLETPAILDELGIRYVGASRFEQPLFRAETVEVKGWRIAYIAATTQRNSGQKVGEGELPFADWNKIRAALVPVITEARADHDLVIVFLHWGTEYADAPDSWQVRAAHAFVDAGADAVIGSHPHVLQGMERYNGALIAYSLGNFLFDNLYGRKRLHGVLHLTFRHEGHCLAAVTYHPTAGTHPFYTPVPARGKTFTAIADRLTSLSTPMSTAWTIDGHTLVTPAGCSP
jgi:poly-gamma-glutamate synthesis protein (capsule biosynthesis protein)